MTSTTNTEPTADPAPSDGDDFVFEALVRFPAGQLEAIVRYDGDVGTLEAAAQQVGVTAAPADADADGHPRIRITGSGYDVQRAVQEYARRARNRRAYELGELDLNTGW